MAKAYPNLEILRVRTEFISLPQDDNAGLSAFRFPHLTTLSLCNLQLQNGSALISVKSKVSFNIHNLLQFVSCFYIRLSKDAPSWKWFFWRQNQLIHRFSQRTLSFFSNWLPNCVVSGNTRLVFLIMTALEPN